AEPASAPIISPAQPPVDKHLKPILSALQLNDPAQIARVSEVTGNYYTALHIWHTANDTQVKELWNDFNQARSAQNVTNANAALAKLATLYAGFKPGHEAFVQGLAAVLTPVQVEAVKDALTVNKVKVTYGVYLQIFPQLTEAQKAVVLADLKQAREEAIDCESMAEKSAFFKKYKIKIEDEYLTAQGYDCKQARKDFAAKSKAAKGDAEKPAAAAPKAE
ncbi:MAG TPA: DUF3826 domain-containing protein, partial [Verrucomicrobiae bacterium]